MGQDSGLVVVVHRDEDRCPRSGSSKPLACCDLAKAMPKSFEIPMTSPVDFISGPSSVSAPGNLRNGNTDSLTKKRDDLEVLGEPLLGERSSRHDPGRHLRERHAGRLAHEGRRARGARVHLEHVDHVVLDGVLDVHQARDPEGEAEAPRVVRGWSRRARAPIL